MSHRCSKIRSKADRPIPASLFLRLPMISGSISSQIRVVTPVAEPDYTWAHSTVKGKRLWWLAARGIWRRGEEVNSIQVSCPGREAWSPLL